MNTNTNKPESGGKPDQPSEGLHPDMQPQAIAPIEPAPQPQPAAPEPEPAPLPVAEPQPEIEVSPPAAPAPITAKSTNGEYRYFKKVMVNMPFIVNKQRIGFEVLSKNTGVIRLHSVRDLAVVSALDIAATARKGGIVAITSEEYEAIKKKLPPTTLEPRSKHQPKLQVWRGPQQIKKQSEKPSALPAKSPVANVAPAAAVKHVSSSTGLASVGVPKPVSGDRPGGEPTGGTPPASTAKSTTPNVARRGPVVRAPRIAAVGKTR